jgi:NAD(P)-dependent dehydrogenase (short-subunit alcohol dehydrogenase family)
MTYIIVGASRGLGASLVGKCLEEGLEVIGIGRTHEATIDSIACWRYTGRFKYVQADIAEPSSVDVIKAIIGMCKGNPICVIFNAAVIEPDVDNDGNLKFDVFKNINRTGIDGFTHVLEAFGNHLTSQEGMLVGISSISAWVPPIGGNKIAYPASKAYLDMVLRSLRLLWDKRVHIMTVHLGHIGGGGSWFVPNYDAVAQKILDSTRCSQPPESICMSTFYCFAYRFLRILPDRIISNAIEAMKGLLNYIPMGKALL